MDDIICCAGEHVLESPVLLTCLHTYCKACLYTLDSNNNQTGQYECMKCHYVSPADMVRDSHYHQSILKDSRYVITCDMCDDVISKKVIYFCGNCEEYYCLNCQALHLKFPAMQDHKIQQTDLKRVLKDTQSVVAKKCEQHGHELTHGCLPCRQLICARCFEDHEEHDVKDVQQAAREGHKQVNSLTANMHNQAASLQADHEVIKHLRTSFKKDLDLKVEEAMRMKDLLIAQVTQEFEDFKQRADDRYLEVSQKYEEVGEKFDHMERVLLQSQKMIKSVQDKAEDSLLVEALWKDVVPNTMELMHAAKQCQEEEVLIPQYELCHNIALDLSLFEGVAGQLKTNEKNVKTAFCPKSNFVHNDRIYQSDFKSLVRKLKHSNKHKSCSLPCNQYERWITILDSRLLLPCSSHNIPEIYQLNTSTFELAKGQLNLDLENRCVIHRVEFLTCEDLVVSTTSGVHIIDAKSLAFKCTVLQGMYGEGIFVSKGRIVALKVGSHELYHVTLYPSSYLHTAEVHVLGDLPVFCDKDTVIAKENHVFVAFSEHNLIYKYNLQSHFLHQITMNLQVKTPQQLSPPHSTSDPRSSSATQQGQTLPSLQNLQICGLDTHHDMILIGSGGYHDNAVLLLSQRDHSITELMLRSVSKLQDVVMNERHMWTLGTDNTAKQQLSLHLYQM